MIIGLSGFAGAGKDTVANILVEDYGFKKVAFADSLKDAVSVIFGWDRDLLEGDTKYSREWREKVSPDWSERLGYEVTPRQILQRFGTETCIHNFDKNIWIHSLDLKILRYKDVVIPDVRFPTELLYLKEKKGISVRVIRDLKVLSKEELNKLHESERAIANYNFDFTISNVGTIDDLYNDVDELLTFSQNPYKIFHHSV